MSAVQKMRSALGVLLALLPGALLLYILLLAVSALAVDRRREYEKHSRFYRALLNSATRLCVWLLGIEVRLEGAEKLPTQGRFLLVGNHRSNFDPILTWYALRQYDLAFLSKAENFRIPVFRRIIRRCCFLPIDREDPRKAIVTIQKAAALLACGEVCVGVYPEGTRSRDGTLLPFHNGVFKIAQKAGAPIVAAAVEGTEQIRKNCFRRRSVVRITITDMIPAETVCASRTAELGARVRAGLDKALHNKEKMMTNWSVLYNPHAACGHGEENARRLERILAADALLFYDLTAIADYAAFFASLAPQEHVVLCGGDGTLNRFLNDTAGLPLPEKLYYFAAGSGNDFLRDTEGSTDAPLALRSYLCALPEVTVEGRTYRFLNGVGYGIDGYCCEVGDHLRAAGKKRIRYAGIAVRGLLFHYQPVNAAITVDGVRHTYKKVWLAPTMNGRYYGGGMMPAPEQKRLNEAHTVSTMVFYGAGKLKTLCIFPSIFKGTHVRHTREVEILTGRDIRVEFDRPTALQIDGETIPGVTEYHVCAAQ